MNRTLELISKNRIFILVLLVVLIVGGVLFYNFQKQIKQLDTMNSELSNVIFERDSIVGDLLSTLDTIENNLTFIEQKRSQLEIVNEETRPSQKEALVNDIRLMNRMLEESSVKIAELDKKLNESGIQLKSFKNKIAQLSYNIEQQNIQIDQFKIQVEDQNRKLVAYRNQNENLHSKVKEIRDSVKWKEQIIVEREEVIAAKTTELNKGFFAKGTLKELVKNGVIAKEGGVLGLGKNKILPNNFNEAYFTRLDITRDKSITLNAKKVNLISEHPSNSYRLVEENGLITKLEIEIPEDFWKISQYAVIEVKL